MSSEEALEGFYGALLDDDAEALYDRAPCGYLSTTPDGTIVKVNQTFLTWCGYERQDLIGRRTFVELLTAGGRIYHETHYAPMLRMQATVREIALDFVRPDGRRLPALVNSVLERDQDGSPLVIRTAVFDATDRREYERELLSARRRAEESEAHARVLARSLQQTLIPPAAPHIPGLDVHAVYRPAGTGDEVGGDFYDIFEISDGDWVIAVGDVCGKGVEAAVVTTVARHTIRASAVGQPEPCKILDTLNQVLLRHETDRFCTVALLRLRRAGTTWTATVSSAGHPLPLLARAGAEPAPLGSTGTVLGILDSPPCDDDDIVLRSGDALVLYTDGVTEARGEQDFFGEERLNAAMASRTSSAAALTDGILSDVLQFQDGYPRDDIVVVAVHVPLEGSASGRDLWFP